MKRQTTGVERSIEDEYDDVTWTKKVYAVTLATILNLTNFTQQYLLVGTIFGMANDLEFGATACMVTNETLASFYARNLNITYDEFCTLPGRCDVNSTSFSPDACTIEYTGMGTLYDILAGPVYLIIEGVSAVPITVLLQAAGVPHIATIASLTIAWSLCTLGTAFVNSYWMVAFLRFLFGIFTGPFNTFIMAYIALIVKPEELAVAFGAASFGRVAGNSVGYLFVAASNVLGWRLCYVIAGTAGIALGLAALLMTKPPRDKQRTLNNGSSLRTYLKIFIEQQRACISQIAWLVLIPVLLGSMCRSAYGYINAYNAANYTLTYFVSYNVENLFYAGVVAGFLGCILGGILSDRLRKNYGRRSTLSLLAGLSVTAAVVSPFAYVVDSSAFIIMYGIIIALIDWSAVLVLSVTSDLAPANCKTVIFALFYLFLFSFGGSFSLLVTPATTVLGLRRALLLLCAVVLTGAAVSNTTALALDSVRRTWTHRARVLHKWKNGMGVSNDSEEIPLIAPGRTSMVLNGGTLNNDLNNMHNGM
ncbi:uncharacterized protein [Diadema setosum]|uniref:uncharacterized protein n=1 Tax=Diadema setosum TaxID=31175 RepID=UPI003B3ADDB1